MLFRAGRILRCLFDLSVDEASQGSREIQAKHVPTFKGKFRTAIRADSSVGIPSGYRADENDDTSLAGTEMG